MNRQKKSRKLISLLKVPVKNNANASKSKSSAEIEKVKVENGKDVLMSIAIALHL